MPCVSAPAIASHALGEEANGEGDDDGRAIGSYFTAWQGRVQRCGGPNGEFTRML